MLQLNQKEISQQVIIFNILYAFHSDSIGINKSSFTDQDEDTFFSVLSFSESDNLTFITVQFFDKDFIKEDFVQTSSILGKTMQWICNKITSASLQEETIDDFIGIYCMEQWNKSLIQIEIIQDIFHYEFENTNHIQSESNYKPDLDPSYLWYTFMIGYLTYSSILLTLLYLIYAIFSSIQEKITSKALFNQHIGYPASFMILSCIMLCSTFIFDISNKRITRKRKLLCLFLTAVFSSNFY